jgi:hypothetical protein
METYRKTYLGKLIWKAVKTTSMSQQKFIELVDMYFDEIDPKVFELLEASLDKTKNKVNTKLYTQEDDAYLIADVLVEQLSKRTSYRKFEDFTTCEKTKQQWSHDINLLLTKDKAELEDVMLVIDYVFSPENENSDFAFVVNSGSSLRNKFPRILERLARKVPNVPKVVDTNEPLTNAIIKAYGQFVGNPEFAPAKREKDQFIITAKRMTEFYSKNNRDRILEEHRIKYLFSCLETAYIDAGGFVTPGYLCSDRTWETLMTQYIRNNFGL